MRIQAGFLHGRAIVLPRLSATRPMTDRVRAALFDVLGSVDGQIVLDAYAGSGAIGLEALSRGAAQAVFIERNRSAAAALRRTITELGLDAMAQVITDSVEDWSKPDRPRLFSVIMADPPYDSLSSAPLDRLAQLLVPGGILVLSHASKLESPAIKSVKLAKVRFYGDSALSFYRR